MNAQTIQNNPLLSGSATPRFDQIKPEHVGPAVEVLMARCQEALQRLVQPDFPADYDKASEVLDVPFQDLENVWGTVHHLLSVADSQELRTVVTQHEPKITALHSALGSDLRLFQLYKRIEAEQAPQLSAAQRRALENSLRGFRLSGAELDDAGKARFTQTLQRSAVLGREFSQHVLDATDAFVLYATESQMRGVPKELQSGMADAAAADGHPGSFKVTLQMPCLMPLMQYAEDRDLREVLYRANATRASEFGPAHLDNGPVVAELLELRHERAKLLGHAHHAEVSLIPKMAQSADQVLMFLGDIGKKSRPKAEAQLEELKAFARARLGLEALEAWDVAFASEKLRQERYAFSEEEVRQYFQLEHVLAGLFGIAQKLFDVQITASNLASWHPDVRTFDVRRGGELLGEFYLDPFARTGKSAGAWMNGSVPRWRLPSGQLRTAVAYLVTNFAAPPEGKPALLRHSDVITLFHEFGHGMHFLLSKVETLGVSGLSGVEWDAVELPSQWMENFAWQWDVLRQITSHVDTGVALPRELFDKMEAARQFMNGLFLVRQVEMGTFDMRVHADPESPMKVQQIVDQVRAETSLIRQPAYNRFQNTFSHIFAGAYSAGYFSYLWADVLASDAWEVFERAGGADPEVGRRYRESILEVGGSRPMSQSFEAFVGRQPTIDALLRQFGLSQEAA